MTRPGKPRSSVVRMTTNSVTTSAETIVRRAYHLAEGNVMDVRGFIDLFADDGVINAGLNSYRGKDLDYIVVFMGKLAPDVHRAGCSNRQQASSMGMEPSSTSRAPTSGMWKTAKSRRSTAMSVSASCLPKWASRPTSHPRSKRRP